MSAYLVSHDHIDAILTAALALPPRYGCPVDDDRYTATTWGRELLGENLASVRYRYRPDTYLPDGDELPVAWYVYRPLRSTGVGGLSVRDMARAIEAVRCYQYQACKSRTWDDSAARKWTDRLIDALSRALTAAIAPGTWGVDDRAFFTADVV